MSKKLFLFTLDGCAHCDESKEMLIKKNITFTELEITKFHELWDAVIEETKQDYVPTVFIQDDSDGSGKIYTPITDYNDVNEMIVLIENIIK